MPIYEYRCTQCGHKLEALQKFSDAPLTTSPACGKEALSKLVSAAGFQLKGSGWYQTDFRGGSKPAAKSEGAESAKGEGKSDSADAPASKESTGASDKAAASTPAAPASPPAASGTSAA